jgi:hypothetical protein
MLQFYGKRGIKAIHFPIHDFNEEDLTEKLLEAAIILDKMINSQNL